MTSTLLMVMHPREITESVYSIAQLDIDKVWLARYTELELGAVIADVVASTSYESYCIVGDDCVVGQKALDAVLELASRVPVATGWANLDLANLEHVSNLTRAPLRGDHPTVDAYDLYDVAEVRGYPEPDVPTWFVGMSFTTMSREMWQRYPFQARDIGGAGCCSDFDLSKRLEADEIPMFGAREGFVVHLKETWNEADTSPRKRLRLREPSDLEWEAPVCAF